MSPSRPLRPCAHPGCPALVRSGRCAAHAHLGQRKRDPAQTKFYSSGRWQKLRALVRQRDPVCVLCGERPSEVVDHINGEWSDNRLENLRGLCRTCNASHTGRQHQRKRD